MAIVQITSAGVRKAPQTELGRARKLFDRQHYLHLPRFFDRDVLSLFQRLLENANFVLLDEGPSRELCLADPGIYGRLEFLLNAPELFEALGNITGCRGIRRYAGHVYRLEPGEGHFVDWHADLVGTRVLGLTVNISARAYTGGTLEIRRRASKRMVARVPNPVAGDALLIRLSPLLEHRVSAIEGDAARIACAGWFKRRPDYRSVLRGALREKKPKPRRGG